MIYIDNSNSNSMFMTKTIIIFISIVVSLSYQICTGKMKNLPTCHPHPLPFTIGHFNMTQTLFNSIIRNNKYVLVLISSSDLPQDLLCNFESLTLALYQRYNESIMITRVDCIEDSWSKDCSEIDGFTELPKVNLYVDKKKFTLSRHQYFDGLTLQIDKLISQNEWKDCVMELDSVESLKNIYKVRSDATGRLIDRIVVLGVFPEEGKVKKEEISSFQSNALKYVWRTDIRFLKITNQVVAERIQKARPEYFEKRKDNNTIVVIKIKNRYDRDDEISVYRDYQIPLESFISEKALSIVEEYTWLNQDSFNNEMPMIFLFLNTSEENRKENLNFLDGYRALAQKYLYRMNFVWCDFEDNLKLMKTLGTEGCSLPCVGLKTSMHNRKKQYVLDDQDHSIEHIEIFIQKYYKIQLVDEQKYITESYRESNRVLKALHLFDLQTTFAFLSGLLKTDNSMPQSSLQTTSESQGDTNLNVLLVYNSSLLSLNDVSPLSVSRRFMFFHRFFTHYVPLDCISFVTYDLGSYRKVPTTKHNHIYILHHSENREDKSVISVHNSTTLNIRKFISHLLHIIKFKDEAIKRVEISKEDQVFVKSISEINDDLKNRHPHKDISDLSRYGDEDIDL